MHSRLHGTWAVALLLGAGCLGDAGLTEEETAWVRSAAGTEVLVQAVSTTGFPAWVGSRSGVTRVSQQGVINLGAIDLGGDGASRSEPSSYVEYHADGPRFAFTLPPDGELEVAITGNRYEASELLWPTRQDWGTVLYHRPAGTRNAWVPLACGAQAGLLPQVGHRSLSVFPGAVTVDAATRKVRWWSDRRIEVDYASCGILEATPEMSAMAVPTSLSDRARVDVVERRAEMDFTMFTSCPLVIASEGLVSTLCPGFPDEARAGEEYCREGVERWYGAAVRPITREERNAVWRDTRRPYSGNQGVKVTAVARGGPAEGVLEVGDVLVTIDDRSIIYLDPQHLEELQVTLEKVGNGPHSLGVIRGGTVLDVPITVSTCPAL